MSSNRKTIKINPELFSLSKKKNKTVSKPRGGRGSRTQSALKPNILKKKLIERVKQHRNRGRKTAENTTATEMVHANNKSPSIETKVINNADDLLSRYNDELNESLDYLSSIAEKNAGTTNAEQNSRKRGKRNKTTKNTSYDNLHVEIELPEKLQPLKPVVPSVLNTSETVTLQEPVVSYSTISHKDDVPYGCLKGGNKPTYKVWNKTMKRALPDDSTKSSPLVVSGSHDKKGDVDKNSQTQNRQQKLAALKDRMKVRQSQERDRNKQEPVASVFPSPPTSTITPVPLEDTSISIETEDIGDSDAPPIVLLSSAKDSAVIGGDIDTMTFSSGNNREGYDVPRPIRKKRTTTRKFKLGKDKQKRTIGVLIKDRHTRKRVIDAQKDMKRKNINEIKQYLKDHGLLKAGSNAPNDILRKMYESCMLTGDVVNGDGDVIMHNFLVEKDNL